MSNELSWAAVGQRLELLRVSKGFTEQKVFADLIGVKPARYNHWERGRQIIPVEYATKICGMTGATLDYLYLGKASALPGHLLSELKILPPGLLGSSKG